MKSKVLSITCHFNIKKSLMNAYYRVCECSKLSCQNFCHSKTAIFGQNQPQIPILWLYDTCYRVLGSKIIIYRHFYLRNDIFENSQCLFSPLNTFFTLLAVKPGSNLQPCLKQLIDKILKFS